MAQFCAVSTRPTELRRLLKTPEFVSKPNLSLFDRTLCEKVRAKITPFFHAIVFFKRPYLLS